MPTNMDFVVTKFIHERMSDLLAAPTCASMTYTLVAMLHTPTTIVKIDQTNPMNEGTFVKPHHFCNKMHQQNITMQQGSNMHQGNNMHRGNNMHQGN